MKPSVTVSNFSSGFGPIMFSGADRSFEQNIRKLQEYGFQAVEIFTDRLTEDRALRMRETLDRCNMSVSMVIFIYLAEMGVNLSLRSEKARLQAVRTYADQFRFARGLGAQRVPLGLIRGMRSEDDPILDYYSRLADSARILTDAAAEHGLTVCLEPINRYEANTLLSVSEAVQFLGDYDLPRMKILADFFHMNIEDVDLCQTLKNAGGAIGHVHASDSNRLSPGMGNLDYAVLMDALRAIRYDGYLTLECLHSGSPDADAKKGLAHLRKFI